MKILIWVFGLQILLAQGLYGQNLQTIQHGYEAGELINPASIVKEEERNHIYLLHNRQLSSFNSSQLNYIRYSHKTKSDKVGFGAEVYDQTIGDLNVTSILVDYNYQLLFSNYNKLSFGLRFGVFQSSLNKNELNPFHNDDFLLNQSNQTKWNTNGSFGARYTHGDFSVEFAIPQLLVSQRNATSQNLIALHPYFYQRTLYTFHPKNWLFSIEPQYVVYKETAKPFSHQVGVQLIFNDLITVYADCRFTNSYKLGLGIDLKKGIYIGYNFQRYLNNSKTFRGLNQEIMLAYRFSKKDHKSAREMVDGFYEQTKSTRKTSAKSMKETAEKEQSSNTVQNNEIDNAVKDMKIPDFKAKISNRDQVIEFLTFRSIIIEDFKSAKFEFNSFDEAKVDFVLVLGIFESQRSAVKYMKTFNSRFLQTSYNPVNKEYYVLVPVEKDFTQRSMEQIWYMLENNNVSYWMIEY